MICILSTAFSYSQSERRSVPFSHTLCKLAHGVSWSSVNNEIRATHPVRPTKSGAASTCGMLSEGSRPGIYNDPTSETREKTTFRPFSQVYLASDLWGRGRRRLAIWPRCAPICRIVLKTWTYREQQSRITLSASYESSSSLPDSSLARETMLGESQGLSTETIMP